MREEKDARERERLKQGKSDEGPRERGVGGQGG